jgi:hypothetical protein
VFEQKGILCLNPVRPTCWKFARNEPLWNAEAVTIFIIKLSDHRRAPKMANGPSTLLLRTSRSRRTNVFGTASKAKTENFERVVTEDQISQ